MGKVYHNRNCSVCGVLCFIIESWGVNYCETCYEQRGINTKQIEIDGFGDTRKSKIKGNGGMVYRGVSPREYKNEDSGITLERCAKGNAYFSDMYLTHYPNSKGIMGRSLNYIVRQDGNPIGIIGGNSPPLNYKLFREYFKTENEIYFLNNNVFRINSNEKNMGTRVLSIFRNLVSKDYFSQYGIKLVGFVTFVEPPRTGAVYKAGNWEYLGMTQGKSTKKRDMGAWNNKEWGEGTKKHIYAIKQNSQKQVDNHISSGVRDRQAVIQFSGQTP